MKMRMPTKFHLDDGAIVYVGEPLKKSNFKKSLFLSKIIKKV